MRRVLASTLVLLAFGPAGTAAATTPGCAPGPATTDVERKRDGDVLRTRVTVCGKTFTAGTYRRGRGRAVLGASAAPDQVAWVEVHRRRRAAALLRFFFVDLSTRKRRMVVIGPRRSHRLPRVPVVVTTQGDGATLISGTVVITPDSGGPKRRAGSSDLRLEDDRTVTWRAGGSFKVHDLSRVERRGVCPQRTGFVQVAASDRIIVTQREYEPGEHYATVVRACDLPTGVERVMRIGTNGFDYGDTLSGIGVSGMSVVMTNRVYGDRYDTSNDCELTLIVRHMSGAPTRHWPDLKCSSPGAAALARGVPLAVTGSGAVAWVASDPSGAQLHAMTGTGPRVLDPLAPGAITDLTAAGEVVRWRRDGVERSATL